MRGKFVLSLVGAGVALATTLAVPAHADDADAVFISVLDDEGISYSTPRDAIKVARAVCEFLYEGATLLDATQEVSDASGLGVEDSGFFVGAATASYCPSESP